MEHHDLRSGFCIELTSTGTVATHTESKFLPSWERSRFVALLLGERRQVKTSERYKKEMFVSKSQ